MEVGEEVTVRGEEESDGTGVNRDLFQSITRPKVFPGVSRDLSWNAVIQTGEDEPSWEGLRNKLASSGGSDDGESANIFQSESPSEIFAVSWPVDMMYGQNQPGPGPEVDGSVLKVSTLLITCRREKVDSEKSRVFQELLVSNKQSYREGQAFALVELDVEIGVEEQFANLCRLANPLTVHWFRAFQFGFMWRMTRGEESSSMNSISAKCSSIKYSEATWLQCLNEDKEKVKRKGCIFPNNVICISGLAGSGKSVLLAKVAHELKKSFPDRLVFFVDLNLLSFQIGRMEEIGAGSESLNFDLFLRLICDYFGIENNSEKEVLNGILSSKAEGRYDFPKLELLLDGLNEMDWRMREILLNYLHSWNPLKYWGFRVWFTTRPSWRLKVERMWKVVSFELEPLGGIDMLSYFQSFNKDLDAEELLSQRFEEHLKLDMKGLLSIPARMTGFQSYLKKMKKQKFHPGRVKLYDLTGWEVLEAVMKNVKRIFKKKQKKNNIHINKEDLRLIVHLHAVLAYQWILGRIQAETEGFTLENHENGMNGTLQLEMGSLLDFGIVKKSVKGDGESLSFVHDQFATYMLVEYYATHVPEGDEKSDIWVGLFFQGILFRDECEEVRHFYNQRLGNGMDWDVSEAWSGLIERFMIRTYGLQCDDDDKAEGPASEYGNLLQLMIIDRKLVIAKLILRSFALERLPELRRLIRRKVKVEVNSLRRGCPKNFIELSALSLGIMFGDVELVEMMYSCVDMDGEEEFGNQDGCRFTPAHLAVIGGNVRTLDYLLEKRRNMDVEKMDLFGHLPLHLVFYNGWDLKFCLMEPNTSSSQQPRLIYRDVKIRKYYSDDDHHMDGAIITEDRMGQLPTLASKLELERNEEHHREYLEMEMNRNHRNFSHKPRKNPGQIWYYNCILSYLSIVERLTPGTSINFQDVVGGVSSLIEPPFHLACAEGYLPIVESMVGMNVNTGIRGKGSTALLTAILKGHVHIVKYLLKQEGMDKDRTELGKVIMDGVPLLHHICLKNLWSMVGFFVTELGQQVDLKGEGGWTPLHFICGDRQGDKRRETVRMLIDLGADVNARDRRKGTPLMYACRGEEKNDIDKHDDDESNFEVIKLLIKNGADVNAQNEIGEGALHFAISSGEPNLVRHLLTICKKYEQVINVNIDTTKMGVGGGGMRAGSTPLHYACRKRGNVRMLKCLIEDGGAKVNPVDSLGQNPLHILATLVNSEIGEEEEGSDEEMLFFLVEHGAWLLNKSELNQKPYDIIRRKNPELATRLFKESNRIYKGLAGGSSLITATGEKNQT